ncbi:DUF6807 domain-containing protein [Catalinimonas niigatensis]|uniref:DUF6807 domain-containing protein n=1 Tax=Catalinimonas niigatensis TaxID=1397264 RepID=UPI002666F4C1|nr:PmoA family protein [Catalinimonas niigatensis]WPP50761.1 PmoA family protein [Catalinimonas niigatensis]
MRSVTSCVFIAILIFGWGSLAFGQGESKKPENHLILEHNQQNESISIYRSEEKSLILSQHAREDTRPYVHPIIAPDGKGVLTQYRPEHHPHQTGLYWGLKRVNERDYFMNWQGDYWRKVSASAIDKEGPQVKWQTVYELLDETGEAILTETQNWSMHEHAGKYLLDLEWKGEAKTDITLGEFYVGGLFLRMPWHEGIPGEVVNANGQRNQEAEGQRAIWTDVGMQVEGRDDLAHITIFDHPDNSAFPIAWRVDGELGVGPSRQILGDWKINKGESEVIRYRLLVYTGALNPEEVMHLWTEYITNSKVAGDLTGD